MVGILRFLITTVAQKGLLIFEMMGMVFFFGVWLLLD